MMQGNPTLAIADYNVAIQLNPAEPLAYVGRGEAFMALGSYEDAAANFREALRLDPQDNVARQLLMRLPAPSSQPE